MKAGKRVGRPSKAPRKGARNSLGLRVTAETKNRLEAAAAASGRSQSQEVEFRLERSFRKEDDGIAALGGSEQHALFRMMAAAAEIIENRTGKSWSSDWETSIAVRDACFCTVLYGLRMLCTFVIDPPSLLLFRGIDVQLYAAEYNAADAGLLFLADGQDEQQLILAYYLGMFYRWKPS